MTRSSKNSEGSRGLYYLYMISSTQAMGNGWTSEGMDNGHSEVDIHKGNAETCAWPNKKGDA